MPMPAFQLPPFLHPTLALVALLSVILPVVLLLVMEIYVPSLSPCQSLLMIGLISFMSMPSLIQLTMKMTSNASLFQFQFLLKLPWPKYLTFQQNPTIHPLLCLQVLQNQYLNHLNSSFPTQLKFLIWLLLPWLLANPSMMSPANSSSRLCLTVAPPLKCSPKIKFQKTLLSMFLKLHSQWELQMASLSVLNMLCLLTLCFQNSLIPDASKR
mmetsp:Transcript_19437/g.54139  ORF Transcript_19437/g.54139 Transcript_19437/m.54139 type:complete len:212 (-) Transcript_19437:528-1163(-)